MSEHDTRPLVVLGIDAGDHDFIRRWARAGHLPTLASLMARGCWGRTAGPELVSEHGVWISLLSGISRGDHGYYYYRQLKPGSYDLAEVTGAEVEAPPFWSALRGSAGPGTVVIDPPDQTVQQDVPGLQLVNWAIHNNWNPDHYQPRASTPDLLREVQSRFGNQEVTREIHESTFAEDLGIYRQLLRRIRNKGALCRHLFAQDDFSLYLTVFAETHAASHQFWKYCPDVPANADLPETELTHALRNVYGAVDQELGLILDELPDHANVVVVSSVGMEDDYPVTGLSEIFFRTLGYQRAPEPGVPSFRPLDLARRLLPEAARLAISRYLPRERREQLLADAFRTGTDWSRTEAFALPSAYTTFVRVNLQGREPRGVVANNGAYHDLLGRIERDLLSLEDPVTGRCPVIKILRSGELFGAVPEVLPDLFVEWEPGRFMQNVRYPGGVLEQSKPDFYRRSDHGAFGFFAAAGPDIAPLGQLDDIEVLDIAPTLLQLLGKEAPIALSGRPLPLNPGARG